MEDTPKISGFVSGRTKKREGGGGETPEPLIRFYKVFWNNLKQN